MRYRLKTKLKRMILEWIADAMEASQELILAIKRLIYFFCRRYDSRHLGGKSLLARVEFILDPPDKTLVGMPGNLHDPPSLFYVPPDKRETQVHFAVVTQQREQKTA